ncbi:MAG: alkyl hydroperoxide reductase, partial [Bacteroidales bacterium]
MSKHFSFIRIATILSFLFGLSLPLQIFAQTQDVSLVIHLRGVSESKISLMSLSGTRLIKPILEVNGIKNGETTKLLVPKSSLPGEFVLRFDYKEKRESTPYPSEKSLIINNQDLELWVSPIYCNNSDSTWFQKGEKENTAFARFSKENGKQKEKIGLLQQFLMNYDDTQSKFYKSGIEEYEKRRNDYNQWLDKQVKLDKAMFVSSLYRFQFVPQIPWEGSETERLLSVIEHYFDGIDLMDPLLIRTSDLNKWMDNYV